jgi:catalase
MTEGAPVSSSSQRVRGGLLLGGILLAVAGTFAYAAGWLNPGKLTAARLVDTFQAVNGPHPGFRRNHAKGVGLRGFFQSNGRGAALSRAAVFRAGRYPVVGRFALGGGQPYAADSPGAVRSMALQFQLPGGEEWRTGMNDMPVFPVNSPEGFHDMLSASLPDPQTGKPNPGAMPAFLARHPESGRALQLIKAAPKSSGFENGTYRSLNAFLFVNRSGEATPVRWAMVPNQPFAAARSSADAADKSYLVTALAASLAQGPLTWRLVVTVAAPGDPTADATLPWPAGREQVDVGTLTIERLEREGESPARDLNFDPLVLPAGIQGSRDPLLSARSAAYSVSFSRREGEPKSPSAFTPRGSR